MITIMEAASIKNQNTDIRCKACFLRSYQRLFAKFKVPADIQSQFLEYFDVMVEQLVFESAPQVQRELNLKFCQLLGVDDLFREEKHLSNIEALSIYNRWKPIVINNSDVFKTTLRLAIAGNVMDYGACDSFDVESAISKVLQADFAIDYSDLLRERIKSAKKVLYLGDNAGEIVFDKLFIEFNFPSKVVYAVKSEPILNDVTMLDALQINMHSVAEIISNGYDAPSTILNKCSYEFMEHYNSADLIISKGQGNLEGLWNQHDPRIFFLLMAKCDVISEMLGVNNGSFVVLNGGHKIER